MKFHLTVALTLALAILPGKVWARRLDPPPGAVLESPIRSVLRQEAFPWYDERNDAVKPLLPDPSSWSRRLGKRIDQFLDWLGSYFSTRQAGPARTRAPSSGLLPTVLFLAAGGMFVVLLWRLWRLYEPRAVDEGNDRGSIGDAARIAGLPAASVSPGLDPWAEALRRRAAGDFAAAVIWLFVGQLLALERAGLIRPASGRTARQYASMIADPILAGGLHSTLTVFEQVYYGHRVPDAGTLERVWTTAEAFRRRLAELHPGAMA